MAESTIKIRIKLAWWVWPYLWLTRLGVLLGLPIRPEVVAADVRRAVKIEITA